jgi:hypothetical protein
MSEHVGFVDPSGGSIDSMTLATAHVSLVRRLCVLDGYWERRPPFSPDSVTADFAEILKGYGITTVTGDRYAGVWPRERFAAHGIVYVPSELTKSELYREFLVLLNSGRVKLPHDKRMRTQFESLERRTMRGGKDSIDHPPSGHDDIANSVAGALVLASRLAEGRQPFADVQRPDGSWASSDDPTNEDDRYSWTRIN